MKRYNGMCSEPPDRVAISIAIGYGVFGTTSFLFAPFLIGALVAGHFTEARAGSLLTLELAAAALGSAAAFFPRLGLTPRKALVLAMVADGLSALATGAVPGLFLPLASLRILAGWGEGICLAATYDVLSRGRSPDRLFAILLATTLLVSAVGLWAIPSILATVGLQGLFVILAAVALGLAVIVGDRRSVPVGSATIGLSNIVIAALAAILLFFGGQGMVWAFIEQIGLKSSLSHAGIGHALAASSLAGLCAAFAATSIAGRWGRRVPIALAILPTLPLLAALAGQTGLGLFTAVVCGLQVCWCFGTPYMMAGLVGLDDDKRVVALGATMQLAGFGLGPALGGLSLGIGRGFSPILYLTAAMSIMSLAVALLIYTDAQAGRR